MGHESTPLTFALDVNTRFVGKPAKDRRTQARFNLSFRRVEDMTLARLARAVQRGHAFTQAPFAKVRHARADGTLTTHRVKLNAQPSQVLALDSDTKDERGAFDWWLADDFAGRYAGLLYTSASHTPDAPRCRVVFALDEALAPEHNALALKALAWRYPFVDRAPMHPVGVLYGSQGCAVELREDLVLPVAALWQEVVEPYLAATAPAQPAHSDWQTTKANAGGQLVAYARAALDGRSRDIARLAEGRYTALKHAAMRVGTLIAQQPAGAPNALTQEKAADRLLDAARACGYTRKTSDEEAARIIDLGLTAGVKKGRSTSSPQTLDELARQHADFYTIGTPVHVNLPDGRTHTGVVEHFTESDDGRLYRVAGAYYPVSWLSVPRSNLATPAAAGADSAESDAQVAVADSAESDARLPAAASVPEAPPNWLPIDDIGYSDGAQRNIYAALDVAAPALDVTVPTGKYLADVAFDLPRYSVLHANTGIGKTHYLCTKIPGALIYVASGVAAVRQTARRYGLTPYYQQEKELSQRIVTTYESLRHLRQRINASEYWLAIDEAHNFGASGFRRAALDSLLDMLPGAWRGVTLTTGTPVPMSHPALATFERVNVASYVRTQVARRVVVNTGQRLAALLQNAPRHEDKTHLIYVQSKGAELERVRAALESAGYAPDEIACLNRDTRDDDKSRRIVQDERLPEGVRAVLTTRITIESVNLRTRLGAVHIYSPLHPALAQQLVNRQRDVAPGVVYWYSQGDGAGYSVDERAWLRLRLDRARHVADYYNAAALLDERLNPNTEGDTARLFRRLARHDNAADVRLLRVATDEDGVRRYDISYTGVDASAFERASKQYNDNPGAYMAYLAKHYGWHWQAPIDATAQKHSATPAEKERAQALKDARQASYATDVAALLAYGEDATRSAMRSGALDTRLAAAAQHTLRILDAMPADGRDFEHACDLATDAGDSKRRVETVVRRLTRQAGRQAGHAHTLRLYDAFRPGEVLTSDEIHARMLAADAQDNLARLNTEQARVNYWSNDTAPVLTKTAATRRLKDLYEVKRTKLAQADGTRANAYVIGAPVSLMSLNNKDKKSETDSSTHTALALEVLADTDAGAKGHEKGVERAQERHELSYWLDAIAIDTGTRRRY